jgi:phospholipase/carboxylesterase
VLLHGFGAPGDDLVGLADGIDAPPGSVLLFPEALHALRELFHAPMFGDARAWWPIDVEAVQRAQARGEIRDLTAEVPDGLAEARAALSAMLDAVAKDGGESDRLVLGGFSQGAMLALDLALHEPARTIDGIVLLSGTLVAEREWSRLMPGRKGTPVFQSHGQSDPILPFSIAERLQDALSKAGLDVTFDRFAGPHTIFPRTLQRLNAWLAALP